MKDGGFGSVAKIGAEKYAHKIGAWKENRSSSASAGFFLFFLALPSFLTHHPSSGRFQNNTSL